MDRLPVEIILYIGNYVSDQSDRLHLLHICRRWRVLFRQIVYNRVSITGPQIQPLTKVVLANPHIGLAIRDLSIKWWSSYNDPRLKNQDGDPLLEQVEELVEQISESPEQQKDWIESLRSGNDEAWLAILLASLPNLTKLSGQYCTSAPRVTRVVSLAARKEPPFDTRPILQRLETLYICNEDHKEVYPDWQFLPFFRLPAIRNVNLSGVKECEGYGKPDDSAVCSASGTASVETLILESSCNGRKGMADLITSCANLQEFKYQHDHQEIWGESYIDFQPRKFYRALFTQRHSLRVLHMSDNGDVDGAGGDDLEEDEEDDGPEAYDRWFGSLTEFNQLQELRIRVENLLNYHDRDKRESIDLKSILPVSLRSLHVAECVTRHCGVLIPNLQGIIAHRKESFPYLEQISISPGAAECTFEPKDGAGYLQRLQICLSFKELFMQVKELCDKENVKFEILLVQ